ncbi:MAG: hypothetical protein EOP00_19175 [Pedobacter sp.]|nr:MAG: hypothetical protein EOP00_19175 [Pedobacter sp.]
MHNDSKSKSQKIFETLIATTAWFAVILQLVIMKDSAINFFSYFTILSNLLVALTLTITIAVPNSKIGELCLLPKTKSAIALYILIVGLIYNLVLRGIWEPKGWQLVADNLLHVVVPIAYVVYWIIFTPKNTLNWKEGISWSYFPMIYLIYSLVRGHFVNWYPYPFLNVTQFGLPQVLLNAIFVLITFAFIAVAMIGFNKKVKQ